MGNVANAISGANSSNQRQRPTGPHRWPSLSFTWEEFQKRRYPLDSGDGDIRDMDGDADRALNGLILSGVLIPETVLERILSEIDTKDVIICNLVSRAWKDIIVRKSYWKKWFKRERYNWDLIPQHVKDKPESWIVFHNQIKHKILTRNFIENHSGQLDRVGWTVNQNGGDGWRIENPPEGCDPLPPDPFFDDVNCAFATSYSKCSQWTIVDLWKFGLTPPVMKTALPFELVCSQMYTARMDCGGVIKWALRVLDPQKETIMEKENRFEMHPQTAWERAEYAFEFKEEYADKIEEVRYLVFIQEGKDNQFWAGHYGPKFARSSLQLRLLPSDSDQPQAQAPAVNDASSCPTND